jgi:hypothetical protein
MEFGFHNHSGFNWPSSHGLIRPGQGKCKINVAGSFLYQLFRNVLVEDFLHGQGHDDFVADRGR